MSGGCRRVVTLGSGVSQCAETTRMARGFCASELIRPRKNSPSESQARSIGGGQSIKKHGPPPCGMKYVGKRADSVDIV